MHFQDQSSLHTCFTQIPNIIFELGLKGNEIAVYLTLKRIAGDRGGCFKSIQNLAEMAGVDVKTLRDIKKTLSQKFDLLNKPLIQITHQVKDNNGTAPDLITIVDIWPENMARYFPKEGGTENGRGGVPKTEGGGVPKTVYKEEPIEEDPFKNVKPPPPEPPPPLPSGGGGLGIKYFNGKGQEKFTSESEIFQFFLKSSYSTELIQAAIKEAKSSQGPINDIFKYLTSICLRLDIKPKFFQNPSSSSEPPKNTTKREDACKLGDLLYGR